MSLAPIVLFAYCRPEHTLKTLRSLSKNDLAGKSELFIYCDGVKENASDKNRQSVAEVRKIIRQEKWCGKVNIIESDFNRGLAKSVIHGVGEIVNVFKKIIVLEDDMETSQYFLKFMNDALDIYEKEEKIISITGYLYPVKTKMPETFFLKGTYCWGWATWKRGWDIFSNDGAGLLKELNEKKLGYDFDFFGTHHYMQMLEEQATGKSDSWALPWYAVAFLKDKLTLLPGRSLIRNIGLDASGTHGDETNNWFVELSATPVLVEKISAEENIKNRMAIADFFKSLRRHDNIPYKVISVIKEIIKKAIGYN